MTYKIVILKHAQKEVRKLPRKDQQRIATAIASLQTDPFRGKQLRGNYEGAWAIRVWPYRIIYTVDRKIVTITILRVGHRQGVYT